MINIDMEMPVSCNVCRFANEWNECVATGPPHNESEDKDVQWYCVSNTRPPWCPLEIVQDTTIKYNLLSTRDIVTCGECKHKWKRGTITISDKPRDIYGCKLTRGVLNSNDDFCSKGEKYDSSL